MTNCTADSSINHNNSYTVLVVFDISLNSKVFLGDCAMAFEFHVVDDFISWKTSYEKIFVGIFFPHFEEIWVPCGLSSHSFSCNGKNATRRRKYGRAGWAIKHFDFQKLAALWLSGEVVNHVESFLAFQCRSFTSSHGIAHISSTGESGKSTHGNNHSHGCSQRWWLDIIYI